MVKTTNQNLCPESGRDKTPAVEDFSDIFLKFEPRISHGHPWPLVQTC
jgi:hypothetical protein